MQMLWVWQLFKENLPHCCAHHMFSRFYLMNAGMGILLSAPLDFLHLPLFTVEGQTVLFSLL
jgi:hypothetical protein